MTFDWKESLRAFGDAAEAFVRLTTVVGDRWEERGLGEWDVRSLVGHTTRSFLTVEAYLAQPAAVVEIDTAADYVRATRGIAAGPEVAERGRAAGRALGDDPVGAVAQIRTRVCDLLSARDGTEVLTTVAGAMRLRDYLPTRTFELTVHGADLASALGQPLELPASAARQALRLVGELAIADGKAAHLLLAATGRSVPHAAFTVL
ncbi:maleylpyruvate isomerase N-terminal domain-containing protein [Nocardioides sp. AN3]